MGILRSMSEKKIAVLLVLLVAVSVVLSLVRTLLGIHL